jgi:hypothetical protein
MLNIKWLFHLNQHGKFAELVIREFTLFSGL